MKSKEVVSPPAISQTMIMISAMTPRRETASGSAKYVTMALPLIEGMTIRQS